VGGIRFTGCVSVCYSIIEMMTTNVLGSLRWFWQTAIPVGLLIASGVVPAAGAADSAGSGTSPSEIVLHQVHILESRDGAAVWEVRADHAEVNEREGFTVLMRVTRPVEITFFSRQGQVFCLANRATVDLKTKDVRLEGAVVARSDQGAELRTEILRWIAATRRLLTDQSVTITRGEFVTQGRGLEAETGLERLRIFQNITSQFGPSQALTGRSRPQ
jgi:LPS export ABC transporter protein LptC